MLARAATADTETSLWFCLLFARFLLADLKLKWIKDPDHCCSKAGPAPCLKYNKFQRALTNARMLKRAHLIITPAVTSKLDTVIVRSINVQLMLLLHGAHHMVELSMFKSVDFEVQFLLTCQTLNLGGKYICCKDWIRGPAAVLPSLF